MKKGTELECCFGLDLVVDGAGDSDGLEVNVINGDDHCQRDLKIRGAAATRCGDEFHEDEKGMDLEPRVMAT